MRVHDGGTLPPDKPVNFIGGKMSAKIVQTFLAVLEAIDDQRCDNQCDPVVQAVATIKACVSVAQLQ